jgi:YhcH/YjgK/YiaL family protein
MLLAKLNEPSSYEAFLAHPVWQEAIEWLRKMPSDIKPGIYELKKDMMMYVNVHGYDTLPAAECRYESHRRYIDIQYCIEGSEFIDFRSTCELTTKEAFIVERDLQFYDGIDPVMQIPMSPGWICILFPEDGHRPKVRDAKNTFVRKLVIKVDLSLFA